MRGVVRGGVSAYRMEPMLTSFCPSVTVTSMRGFLSKRLSILEAAILALVASGANELARTKEKAVKTMTANTLQWNQSNLHM